MASDAKGSGSADKACPPYTAEFSDVFKHELEQVTQRRRLVHGGKDETKWPIPGDTNGEVLEAGLVGVAFSGGGIRSATFNLGVLQALGACGLLTRVDYLSSVSGGGYVAGWLAAWVRRAEGTGSDPVVAVQKHLNPATNREETGKAPNREPEPEPVHHLRTHSRYLALRGGLLSLDSWTLPAIYVRNLVINLAALAPLLLTLAFAVRWVVAAFARARPSTPAGQSREPAWYFLLTLGLLVFAINLLIRWRVPHTTVATKSTFWPAGGVWIDKRLIWFARLLMATAALAAWLFGPTLGSIWPGTGRSTLSIPADWRLTGTMTSLSTDWRLTGAATTGLFFGAGGLPFGMVTFLRAGCSRGAGVLGAVAVAQGLAFGLAAGLVVNFVLFFDGRNHPALFATVGPPLMLAALLAGGYVEVALAGSWMTEHEREWRSRLAALTMQTAAGWLAVFGGVVYLPGWLIDGANWLDAGVPGDLKAVLFGGAVTWAALIALGVLAARRATPAGGTPGRVIPLVATVIPPLFLAGLLVAGSAASTVILRPEVPEPAVSAVPDSVLLPAPVFPATPIVLVAQVVVREEPKPQGSLAYWQRLEQTDPYWAIVAFGACLVTSVLAIVFIPATLFSLHPLYMNRLTRCYLGASRRDGDATSEKRRGKAGLPNQPRRRANPFSGFDPDDDLPLAALRVTPELQAWKDKPYLGPYPIFNTTLNLVAGEDLAYQDRKGASFFLTPDYCGSRETGYACLANESAVNLTVGRAMTISGAAVDPNMNIYQSGALTAMLTILNARLGWWLRNPAKFQTRWYPALLFRWALARCSRTANTDKSEWDAAAPQVGAFYYLWEMLGLTTATDDFVHLTDGGHFDNSGGYELLRRRCRYVVVVDAAEDPADASENLATLVRLARVDFGLHIEIDTAPLAKRADRTSPRHCAVGEIWYDKLDENLPRGVLVFIRSSMTGDEPADLRNYAANNEDFPHHSTANQFFDEALFEVYRDLGYHIGKKVFQDAADAVGVTTSPPPKRGYARLNDDLFQVIRAIHPPMPKESARE